MQATPEQGLRAWAEYLRDMGVYELYRSQSPTVPLSEELRERLLAARAAESSRKPILSSQVAPPVSSSPLSRAQKPVPSSTRSEPPQPQAVMASGQAKRHNVQEPAKTYFSTEAELPQALPPELAAPMPKPQPLASLLPLPAKATPAAERAAALQRLQGDIGDCTRCPLAYAGRHTVVFGEGDPNARLMFVGEGPGADEDESGRPFVGKAGQLLNNMITAMGLAREAVYIANIVKCRPPGNRTPEFVEATTCSQFLLSQIDIIRPQIIVALGSTAATYVLGVRQSLASLRGQWFDVRGAKLAVTYHPAFLLRDPRQKAEAWKDLQRVMGEMGLQPATSRKS